MKLAAYHFAMAATLIFATTIGVAQFIRKDLNPFHEKLSAYLGGPSSVWARFGYYCMAGGLAATGWLCWQVLPTHSGWVATLFTISGMAMIPVIGTSFGEGAYVPPSPASRVVHRTAALTAFGSATAAILLQSILWHHANSTGTTGLVIAVVTVVLFLVQTPASSRLPRGLVQKALTGSIVAWILWALLVLVRPQYMAP